MTYDELLATHPGVRGEADKVAGAVKAVWTTARSEGGTTTKITQIFSALIPLVVTLTTFLTLNAEGKALVFAEAFDAAVGTEDTALIKEFSIFGTEETEMIGDTFKKIAFKIFHRQFLAAEVAPA